MNLANMRPTDRTYPFFEVHRLRFRRHANPQWPMVLPMAYQQIVRS